MLTFPRNYHDPDNFLGMLICKTVEVICQMSFLSIDIQLTELQEPECVVGNWRVVGLLQKAVCSAGRSVR